MSLVPIPPQSQWNFTASSLNHIIKQLKDPNYLYIQPIQAKLTQQRKFHLAWFNSISHILSLLELIQPDTKIPIEDISKILVVMIQNFPPGFSLHQELIRFLYFPFNSQKSVHSTKPRINYIPKSSYPPDSESFSRLLSLYKSLSTKKSFQLFFQTLWSVSGGFSPQSLRNSLSTTLGYLPNDDAPLMSVGRVLLGYQLQNEYLKKAIHANHQTEIAFQLEFDSLSSQHSMLSQLFQKNSSLYSQIEFLTQEWSLFLATEKDSIDPKIYSSQFAKLFANTLSDDSILEKLPIFDDISLSEKLMIVLSHEKFQALLSDTEHISKQFSFFLESTFPPLENIPGYSNENINTDDDDSIVVDVERFISLEQLLKDLLWYALEKPESPYILQNPYDHWQPYLNLLFSSGIIEMHPLFPQLIKLADFC